MSYDIIYDKQFVKANDKYLPIVLIGSNNCFEIGTRNRDGRRVREWWDDTYICNGKRYATSEEIMARVDEIRQQLINRNIESNKRYIDEGKPEWIDNYSDDHFGYYSSIAIGGANTRKSTFAMYKSIYKNGIDKALTIEQLAEEGVYLNIYTYSYSDETKNKCKELGIEYLESVTIKTTEELLEQIEKFENHYKDTAINWYITFNNHGQYFESKIKRIRKKYFPKNKREYKYVEVKGYYTVVAPNDNYFYKLTSRGYMYSYSPKRKFVTEKEAQRFVNKYKNRIALKIEHYSDRVTQIKVLV